MSAMDNRSIEERAFRHAYKLPIEDIENKLDFAKRSVHCGVRIRLNSELIKIYGKALNERKAKVQS